MKVILDMDPGIDDALALLLALNSKSHDILAVTTVAGNVNVQKTTRNALTIIDAMEKRVPVHTGAALPLKSGWQRIEAESFHGSDGLGDANLPVPEARASTVSAVEATMQLLQSHKSKEISIVATGPLTNVATLIEKDPSLAKRIDRIYIMGGTFDPAVRGNVTEYAEFNFYCDPEAAKIVFDFVSSQPNSEDKLPVIVASGLDVTSTAECAVTASSLAAICSLKSKAASIACKILQYPVKTYSYFNLHDVFTLYSHLHPEIFKLEKCGGVDISCSDSFRGRCTVRTGSGNVIICRQVNSLMFNRLVFQGLS